MLGGNGYGRPNSGYAGLLNDGWAFAAEAGEWSWIGGHDTSGAPSALGLGEDSAGSSRVAWPGGRRGHSVSLPVGSATGWLFGGEGIPQPGSSIKKLNDLWRRAQPTPTLSSRATAPSPHSDCEKHL